jgi:hypothetical protein
MVSGKNDQPDKTPGYNVASFSYFPKNHILAGCKTAMKYVDSSPGCKQKIWRAEGS